MFLFEGGTGGVWATAAVPLPLLPSLGEASNGAATSVGGGAAVLDGVVLLVGVAFAL